MNCQEDRGRDRAKEQAKFQLKSVCEMVSRLKSEDSEISEIVREEIELDAISVEVRSSWHSPGQDDSDGEYRICLCTGGPAVQIVGELDSYNQPYNATLQYQDWFTEWEDYDLAKEEEANLVRYCSVFYFGG